MSHQTGGVDPGLAALIASLLSSGIGAYGFSKETRSAGDEATERLRGEYESKLKEAEIIKNQAATRATEVSQSAQKIAQLEAERDRLTKALELLKADAERNSGPAIAFRNATPEILQAAAPILLSKLSTQYPWIKADGSSTPLLKKQLVEYPTEYSARLMRMSLPDFYRKRILKSAQADYASLSKGGRSRRYRRRARRGGQTTMERELEAMGEGVVTQAQGEPGTAASYTTPSFSFPSLQEFGQLYSDAIMEATSGQQARKVESEQAKKDATTEKAQKKKDATAVKAANALADKMEKAIKTAKAEIAKVTDPEFLERIKEETGDFVHYDFDRSPGVADLRAVKTETEWNDLKDQVSARLEGIIAGTKQLVDLVKAEKNAPPPPTEEKINELLRRFKTIGRPSVPLSSLPPAPAPEDETFEFKNPLLNRETEQPKPAPQEAVPVSVEDVSITNPIRKLSDVRKEMETELAKEGPRKLNKLTRRKTFGGKSRKSTLKKRRGGK